MWIPFLSEIVSDCFVNFLYRAFFSRFVFDEFLLENQKGKDIFGSAYQKWLTQDQNLSREDAENLYNKFYI